MSVLLKIIKAESQADKKATKRIVENAEAIKAEAQAIAKMRGALRGKDFTAAMTQAGFASLAERDQRNNLAAIVWLADEGMEFFNAWLADENRANCSTIRGIKKAVSPKQERAPKQPSGDSGEGDNEGEGDNGEMSPSEVLELALRNALNLCKKHNVDADEFVSYVNGDESMKVWDEVA